MNTAISTGDLRRAIAIREKIESLESELASLFGGRGATRKTRKRTRRRATVKTQKPRRKKRRLSPEARARIVAAVKARWERERAKKSGR